MVISIVRWTDLSHYKMCFNELGEDGWFVEFNGYMWHCRKRCEAERGRNEREGERERESEEGGRKRGRERGREGGWREGREGGREELGREW